jgi:predicted Fe-S protein YdhL (DUF1289 family)
MRCCAASGRGLRQITAIAFGVAGVILPRLSPKRAMAAIESPCNKICTVDPMSRLCVGCGRSLAEIEGWIRFTAEERARIMADLPRRLTTLGRRAAAPVNGT